MGDEAGHEDSGAAAGGEDAPALRVITAFGGIRPMATKLDVPVSTVQGWKARGVIPGARHSEIRAAAKKHGVAIDEAALAASAEAPEEGEATGGGEAEPEAAEAGRDGATQTPSVSPPPLSAPPAGRTHGSWLPGFIAGALVLALGAGGAVLTRDYWAPRDDVASVADGKLSEQVTELAAQLDELAKRDAGAAPADLGALATKQELADLSQALDRLEGRLEAPAGDTAKLSERVTQLEGRVTSLGSGAAEGAKAASELGGLQSALAELESGLAQMRTQLAKLDERAVSLAADQQAARRAAAREAALWAAVGRLRDALRYSDGFAPELKAVRSLAGGTAGLEEVLTPLDEAAATGLPSRAALRRDFPARQIVAASRGDAREGVWGDVLSRVSQVVTVRRTGASASDDRSADAVVARAEGHLEDGDLAAAATEIAALQGAAAEAAQPWLAAAERRLAADAAITALDDLLTARLTTGG